MKVLKYVNLLGMEIKNYNKMKNIFQNKNQIIQKDKVDT